MVIKCGCGKHYLTAKGAICWQGKHWLPLCVFHEQQECIASLREEVSGYRKKEAILQSLQKVVEHLKCPLCNRQLGKQYKMHGDNLYHSSCLVDIGGEG